jgi:hypothetical protein
MAGKLTAKDLDTIFSKLEQERQHHVDAVAEIDELCSRYGISLGTGTPRRRRRRGRPRKAGTKARSRRAPAANGRRKRRGGKRRTKRTAGKAGKRRRRGGISGPDSIVGFVKRGGAKGVTSADLSKHWNSEKRAGSVFVVLTKMVQSGRLRKQSLKGERGSMYRVA